MSEKLKTITQAQLVRKLKRDRSIDYLAIVTSSWHYLSALSTIMWLKEKKGVNKGIILVFEHITDGHIISKNLLNISSTTEMEIYDYRFGMLADQKEVRNYLLHHDSAGKPFYILRPVAPKLEFSVSLYNLNVRKNIIHIVLEEGLAVYMRDWRTWALEEMSTFNVVDLWKQLKLRTWGKAFSELMLKRNREFTENTLFVKKNGLWVKNKRAIFYFKKTFDKLRRSYDFSPYEEYRNSVIICTQTYGDQGHILHNADIETVRRFCQEVRQKGYHVIIKPHPREKNLEKYKDMGASVDLQNDVPLEIILAGISPKPACIVGITTTTLITAKLFWNIPSISLAQLIPRENYVKEFVKEIDNFSRVFSNVVQLPFGLNEINL